MIVFRGITAAAAAAAAAANFRRGPDYCVAL